MERGTNFLNNFFNVFWNLCVLSKKKKKNLNFVIEPKQAYPDLTVLCRFFDGISSVL
jgi:hypothetical protein